MITPYPYIVEFSKVFLNGPMKGIVTTERLGFCSYNDARFLSDRPTLDHGTIVIRAPAGTKTRWVRQSQAQHRKLSDWVVDSVDRPANKTVNDPCAACGSFVLVSNARGWQRAMCGVVAT